jgi:subtilisin family serine protease
MALCLFATLLEVPAGATEAQPVELTAAHVPGEVVVRFDTGSSAAARAIARTSVDGERITALGRPGLELMELDGTSVRDAIAELESRPDVVYAEPNYLVSTSAVSNDPYLSEQWGLEDASGDIDIDASEAWDVTTGNENVLVAVVDTGVAWTHPDLAQNVWTNPGEDGPAATNGIDDDENGLIDDVRGWDWVEGDNDPMDVSGHGTHVAGTIAARGNNGVGVSGVGWNTKVLPLRVLSASGSGGSAEVAMAFWYAARAGAQVVNASFGSGAFSQAVSEAVAQNPDVLFVAAAGNDGTDNDQSAMYPCNLPHVNLVCVTAISRDNSRPAFANVGSTSVDLAAPGALILSTVPNLGSPFRETFEADVESRWSSGGTSLWGPAPGASGGGYADSPNGSYAANANTWLAMKSPIDTDGAHACALEYSLKLDTARPDAFYVETSTDGSTWTTEASYFGSTEGTWLTLADDLGSLGSQLYVRFRLVTDGSISRDGASVDNVVVRCAAKSYSNNYAYSSGTSMAAPHVSGVAGLMVAAAPTATVPAIRSALLGGVDPVPALTGRTLTGGRVNAARSLDLLISSGPPAPTPTPTPTPTSTPSPSPSETSVPSPTPTTPVDPLPTPTLPVPDPTIAPPAEPEPELHEHGRSVTAKIVRGPRLRGSVSVADGYVSCLQNVQVQIMRNGRPLKSIVTSNQGRFVVRVPSARGRYRAQLDEFQPSETHICSSARSAGIR